MQFATHHLGHFQLTLGLLPAPRAARGARVVNVTSGAQRLSDIRGYAVHPGAVVGTALDSGVGQDDLRAMGLIDAAGQPVIDPGRGKKTPEQGAAALVFAATSPLLDGIGGVYLKDSDIAPPSTTSPGPSPRTASRPRPRRTPSTPTRRGDWGS
ncbi:hypothetical protein ACQB60_18690 [Actinomycetota bacterium Odt1-20B]